MDDELKPLYRRHIQSQIEQMIFDPVEVCHSEGKEYLWLKAVCISCSQNLIGYVLDFGDGNNGYTCILKNLESNKDVGRIENVNHVEWHKNGQFIYYTIPDASGRPYQLWLKSLGEHNVEDQLIYSELDDIFYVDMCLTKDKRYLVVNSCSRTSSEVFVIDMNEGNMTQLKSLGSREENVEYYVEHNGDCFYILSNTGDKDDFSLYVTEAHLIDEKKNWRKLLDNDQKIAMSNLHMFENYGVLMGTGITNGQPCLQVLHLESEENHPIPIAEWHPCALHASASDNFSTDTFKFVISSPTVSEMHCEYNMRMRRLECSDEAYTENDSFQSEVIFAKSQCGLQIPITLITSKTCKPDGTNPLLMEVYGAYGSTLEADFDPSRYPLLSRGWAIALVHCRGGGELGRKWHSGGKRENKIASIMDFLNARDFLVKGNFCNPKLLAAKATSAGALVVGAAVNRVPNAFTSVVLDSPFLDLLSIMSKPDLPATKLEYDEWGNPNNAEDFSHMASCCPYLTIQDKTCEYPAMLIMASINDARIPFWSVYKWVSKVRSRRTSGSARPLILGISDVHGHTIPEAMYNINTNAFLLKTVSQ